MKPSTELVPGAHKWTYAGVADVIGQHARWQVTFPWPRLDAGDDPALRPKPEERYQSAAELRDSIQHALVMLNPTISIDQRAGSQNPRSTVATVTEVYDHLRLLFARLGEPACFQCGATIRQQTPEQIIEDLLALPQGTKLMIMAPLVRGRKGQHKDVLDAVRKSFVRVRIDGEVLDVDQLGERRGDVGR